MRKGSKSELRSKIEVKLFVTELCPQCVIAINRINEVAKEIDTIKLHIVNISNKNNGANNFIKLAVMPYYLINEKYVVPGTSSKNYLQGVIHSTLTNA